MNGPDNGGTATSLGWVIRHLARLLWPRGRPGLKARIAVALALILAARLIAVGAPILYKGVVDALSVPAIALVPIALIVAYGLAHVGVQVVAALRQLIFLPVAQRAIRRTATEVFGHLHRLPLSFHLDRQTGAFSPVVSRGIAAIEYLLELALFSVLPTLIELALVTAILWNLYSIGFAAAVAATIVGYGVFTVAVTGWQIRLRRETNARDVAASIVAFDSVLNYETVKYFGAERNEAERFQAARRAYERAAIRSESAESLVAIGQAGIIAAGLIAVMIMAARGVAAGEMTVGDFVLVVAYLLQLYAPLAALGTVYGNVRQSLVDIEAMDWLLRQPIAIEDKAGAPALAVARGRIVFDGVSFAYDSRRPILDRVSFEVPPGRTVALVGPTGAGKSTVTRLLFRFYDVGGGGIRIDGQDLRAVTLASLRQAIGVVPQDTVLFHDSLYRNIAYGRAGATRQEVEAAARAARLHDFAAALPEGYDTQVGERGLKLSGGERQRVAIARVILKAPPILIFDEATSALDSRTEREIQESLRELALSRTTLVIAHRLSTIVDADQILVLDRGRVVERGRHVELVAASGLYAAMWRRQAERRDDSDAGSSFAGPTA